jgi:hypothetical protein
MRSFRLRLLAQVLPFLLVAPGVAPAQAPPTRGEAMAALNSPANPASRYSRRQIDQMVAPIALYPDQLLAQVLMAATYPQQIAAAAQWLSDPGNAALSGDALVAALEPMPWDASVKALVAFPQIIAMMADHIEWTEALGVAFVTQQRDVMARVQALRHLAARSGRLRQMRHLAIREDGPIIVIAEAEPDVVYVPVYNPISVYGVWPDRDFPPVYLPPPPGFIGETIEPGFSVSAGIAVIRPLWGWSRPDWRANRITVERTEYRRFARNVDIGPDNTWRHSGPVVLVAPGAGRRTEAATRPVPAGTIAPARAAAVIALPQQAARQPGLIRTETSAAQPAAVPPGQGQTQTGLTQPSPTAPSVAKPEGTAKPEEAKRATTQPGVAAPGEARQTGAPGSPTAPPAAAKPGEQPAAAAQPSSAPAAAQQPAKTEPATGQALPPHQAGKPSPDSQTSGRRSPGGENAAGKPAERAPPTAAGRPGTAGAKPVEEHRDRGSPSGVTHGQVPEHAGATPSPVARPPAPPHPPQQAVAPAPMPAPVYAPQQAVAPPRPAVPLHPPQQAVAPAPMPAPVHPPQQAVAPPPMPAPVHPPQQAVAPPPMPAPVHPPQQAVAPPRPPAQTAPSPVPHPPAATAAVGHAAPAPPAAHGTGSSAPPAAAAGQRPHGPAGPNTQDKEKDKKEH